MKVNLVEDIINAFSFRKWNKIAIQNDLVLSQDDKGKFSCADLNGKVIVSRSLTAREAVTNAVTVGMVEYLTHGV